MKAREMAPRLITITAAIALALTSGACQPPPPPPPQQQQQQQQQRRSSNTPAAAKPVENVTVSSSDPTVGSAGMDTIDTLTAMQATQLNSVLSNSQDKDAGYPTGARRIIAGLGVKDILRVEVRGPEFHEGGPAILGQPSIREPKNIDQGPITSKNPKVIRAFLRGLEQETSYSLRYAGPDNYLILVLKPSRPGKPSKELEFCVQPRDPAYNGPAMQEALHVLSQDLAQQARKTAHALLQGQRRRVERVSIHLHNPYAWGDIIEGDAAAVEEVLRALETVGPESFDFSRCSQVLFIRFYCSNKEHKVLRLRVPIYNDEAQLYPAYSPDMDSPPLPPVLWKRVIAPRWKGSSSTPVP